MRAAAGPAAAIPMRRLVMPTVLGLIAFFALLTLSFRALTNFPVVALISPYGVTLSVANAVLTLFLLATASGMLAGGFIADAARWHMTTSQPSGSLARR